jgi:hypothetical protein
MALLGLLRQKYLQHSHMQIYWKDFHSRTLHLNIIKGVRPTDAQVYKTSVKIYIKQLQNVSV